MIAQLSEPGLAEKQLADQLIKYLLVLSDRGEKLPFADFMSAALYTPNMGYYANGLHKFGAGGDFITAPELSPLFGQCIARQVVEINSALDSTAAILELGAGSGALAESILLYLSAIDAAPQSYFILEPSASLQQRQQERLQASLPADIFASVHWLSRLPENFVGVILGNEVVDALPVEVIRLLPNDAEQAFVRWDDAPSRFDWDWQPIVDVQLQEEANVIRQHVGEVSERGYQTEICRVLPAWVASLADCLQQGAILLIDYGYSEKEYYASRRWMGSLRAHYQQRAHNDPFWYPGLQDLTAHVNFTALAYAGFHAGLQVAGYNTQAHFLLALGITGLIDEAADVLESLRLAQQIKTLTMPDEMGENFKVMAFLKGMDLSLSGFALQDLRTSL